MALAFDVAEGITTATTVLNAVLGWVADNPILSACFILGTLVPAGIVAFNNLKHAAR